LALTAFARQKEFTILDGQKIKVAFERGMPLPADHDGVRIEVVAIATVNGELVFNFGFTTKRPIKKVVVDEVSGRTPITLVEDSLPTTKKDYWMGRAVPLPITAESLPWLFASGDTTKIFRFAVTTSDRPEPIILFQPGVYRASVKQLIRQSNAKNG
jgi:hypothetical protein